MISHTLFAVSDDETRYFMNGVYLEKQGDQITMVATDGRRLAYASKTMESSVADFKGVIIPPKLLNILRRQAPREGEFQVAVSEREFHVRYESQKLASNLIDAQFPNYQRVIPDRQEHRLVIDRAAFEEGLRRVALLVEQKSRRIYLESQSDNLVIRSSEGEIGAAREEIECEYQGPELVLAFNYEYLLGPVARDEHRPGGPGIHRYGQGTVPEAGAGRGFLSHRDADAGELIPSLGSAGTAADRFPQHTVVAARSRRPRRVPGRRQRSGQDQLPGGGVHAVLRCLVPDPQRPGPDCQRRTRDDAVGAPEHRRGGTRGRGSAGPQRRQAHRHRRQADPGSRAADRRLHRR